MCVLCLLYTAVVGYWLKIEYSTCNSSWVFDIYLKKLRSSRIQKIYSIRLFFIIFMKCHLQFYLAFLKRKEAGSTPHMLYVFERENSKETFYRNRFFVPWSRQKIFDFELSISIFLFFVLGRTFEGTNQKWI